MANKIFLLIIGILVLGFVVWFALSGPGAEREPITSFEECEAAGYPVMESFPRQCRAPDGQLFVEVIEETSFNTSGKYISALDWPPLVQFVEEPFSCAEAGLSTDRAGRTELRVINGRNYCVTRVVEGAAGSIYTQYAYVTEAGARTMILTFSVRASQCGNFPEEEQDDCRMEQEAFDPDPVVDSIARENL